MDEDDTFSSPAVIFEEEKQMRRPAWTQKKIPAMMTWVIAHSGGRIKNEAQARTTLLIFVLVAFVITAILLFSRGGHDGVIKAPPGRTVVYPANEPPRLAP